MLFCYHFSFARSSGHVLYRCTMRCNYIADAMPCVFILQTQSIASLYFDFYLNTAWQFKLHERVNSFWRRTVDIQKSFVRTQLELLSTFLIHVWRSQHSKNLFMCRQWNWSCHNSSGTLYSLYDFFSRFVY